MNTGQQDNSDIRAQEHEGHALVTKTLRSHITKDYAVFNVLRQGQWCSQLPIMHSLLAYALQAILTFIGPTLMH